MNKYFVYKHTTPSGNVYIGITCQRLSQRWANGKGYKCQKLFARSIDKYGWDNIRHEVLFEGLTKEQAEQKEIELIAEYKSKSISLNAANGGQVAGGWHQTDDVRQKLSKIHMGKNNSQYGRHHSDEHRQKISQSLIGRPRPQNVRDKISTGQRGKSKSEQHKIAISESIKGRKFMHKDGQLKQVKPCDIPIFESQGWILGYITKSPTNS